MASSHRRVASPRARVIIYTALLLAGAAVLTAASWSVFRHGVDRTETGLPVLGKLPAFSLTASSGEPLSQAQLTGRVWVADFIFTRCPGICPVLSERMAKVQHVLQGATGPDVHLVSFSVDPTNDTPPVLRAYGERFGADPSRWLFVTGERSALHALIRDGFRLAVAERSESENTDGEGLITHSDRFVLIDQQLQIRGYYHGSDESSVQQLLADIQRLQAP